MLTRWECNLLTLVLLYSWEAKYVPIDTNSLYYLLGSKLGLDADIHTYAMNQQMHWQSHFQLPDALFTQEIASGRKIFQCKWVLTYDEGPEQRRSRLQVARDDASAHLHAHVIRRTDTNDVVWIGVDPGHGSIITAAKLDDDIRWQWQMSSKQYHHMIKMNQRMICHCDIARRYRWLPGYLLRLRHSFFDLVEKRKRVCRNERLCSGQMTFNSSCSPKPPN
ncbi:hypothetical protein INT43_007239 [Umbelopsis isabellina]|uniref:Uncharacterized protein n=1 Tax=Mortierella isabellina TaxID=91625 RepID=A0A8H7PXX3_MORIS|nr:hypothetical protein INT43_007239 [Umbelopsis isabellina]